MYVAKTKALISFSVTFAVTAKLICVFVFAYAKSRFSHDAAHKYSCICAHKLLKSRILSLNTHVNVRPLI